MPPKKPKKEEEPEVTCPVCGNPVSLDDPFCPHCGAEFEEEEVEEIIDEEEEVVIEEELPPEAPEVEPEEEPEIEEEEEVEIEAEEEEAVDAEEEEVEEVEEVEEEIEEEPEEEPEIEEAEEPGEVEAVEEAEAVEGAGPEVARTGLFDLRVFGIALLILGIFGAQVAVNLSWYWTWVPPITSNMAMYAIIAVAILAIGFLAFMMIKKAVAEKGMKVHPLMPTILLSLFIFGIIALIMVFAAGPINDLMGDSQIGMAGVFAILAVLGVVLFILGQKKAMATGKPAESA